MQNRLKNKISLIKELDKTNKYSFSNKVSLDDILVFENKYQLKLPDDFKDFVTKVTNGIKDNEFNNVVFDETNFRNYFADLDDENHNPYIEFPVIERTKDGTNGFDYDELTNGGIWLAGTGCGNGYMLIIKGKAKGQVWLDELASNSEVIPWKKDFNSWINSKLDDIIKELNQN
jgi:hypothetical protein